MSDILTFPEQNINNIRMVKENINMKEIDNYLNEYDINILSYIPFLLNTDIISIVNLDSNTNLSYENIVNNNGIIEEINPHNEDDLIYDINGKLTFPKTSTSKDFYYTREYTTTPIEIREDNVNDPEIFNYINEDQHYNFMFYFSTDKITNRNIALLNGSELIYINRGYLCVSVTLISPDYLRSYNVTLNSLTTLKVGREYHIAVIRDIYGGKYRYSLFINGSKHDSQEMIEEDAEDLKIGDGSSEFNYDDPIKTQFWFHEDPGIKTTIDELYLFDIDSSIKFDSISISTKHNILPFPFNFTKKNKINRSVVNTEKVDVIIKKDIIKSISLINDTVKYKQKVFKFDTSVQLELELKSDTLVQHSNIFKQPLKRCIIKEFDGDKKFKFKLTRRVESEYGVSISDTRRLINRKITSNIDIIRYPAIKLRTLLDEIEDIKNGIPITKEKDLNPHLTTRIVGNKNINNVPLSRYIQSNIICKAYIRKYISYEIITNSDTRRKIGGVDEFAFNTSRSIKRDDVNNFDLIRLPAIPVKTRDKITCNVVKTVSNENNLLKPINTYRLVNRIINVTCPVEKIVTNNTPNHNFKTRRYIKGVIRSKASTSREVERLSHPFVFIFNTEYYY